MNAAAPWTRVLLAPWQQRRNQGSVWALLAFIGAVWAAALAGIAFAPADAVAALVLAVLAMPFFGAWIWLLLSLMQQNHPTAARLVPGQLRTLRRVLLGAWLVFTGLAALVGAVIGHPWGVGACAAWLLIVLTWSVHAPLLGVAFWLALVTNPLWRHAPILQGALDALAATWHHPSDGIALAALSSSVIAALASPYVVLAAGGAQHVQAHGRRAAQLAALHGGAGAARGPWRGGGMGLYRRRLASATTRRTGAVLPRAMLGLGPTIHWTAPLGQLPTVAVMVAVVLLVLWQIDPIANPVAAWGLSAGVLIFAVDVALKARAAIHGTRREQALMMLLPGMPRGHALNRALARRLSVQFICSWALGVLACALVLPLGERFGWFAIYAAACLPLGALLWTDWSRVQAPTAMSAVVPLLAMMLLALGALAVNTWVGVPAWVGVLGFTVAAVLSVALRARRLADAPSAFPAARRA